MKCRIRVAGAVGKMLQKVFGIHSPSADFDRLSPGEMKEAFLKGYCEQKRSESLEMYEAGKHLVSGIKQGIEHPEDVEIDPLVLSEIIGIGDFFLLPSDELNITVIKEDESK